MEEKNDMYKTGQFCINGNYAEREDIPNLINGHRDGYEMNKKEWNDLNSLRDYLESARLQIKLHQETIIVREEVITELTSNNRIFCKFLKKKKIKLNTAVDEFDAFVLKNPDTTDIFDESKFETKDIVRELR